MKEIENKYSGGQKSSARIRRKRRRNREGPLCNRYE